MFSDMVKVNKPPKNSVKATFHDFLDFGIFSVKSKPTFKEKVCLRSNRDINDRRRENLSPYKNENKEKSPKEFFRENTHKSHFYSQKD